MSYNSGWSLAMTDERKPKGVQEAQTAFEADAARAPGAKPAGKALKIRRIGNSLGVVLPKDALARLRVGEGDHLSLSETPEGLVLSPYDEDIERQMEAARRGMRHYRNALRELAK